MNLTVKAIVLVRGARVKTAIEERQSGVQKGFPHPAGAGAPKIPLDNPKGGN
jgi:hypothetical protein